MQSGPCDLVEFGVLGPLLIKVNGDAIDIGTGKVRVMLVSLLLRPNRLVSVDELACNLWSDELPTAARGGLHKHVNRLRNALGAAGQLIRTEAAAGYRIDISRDAVDLERFRGYVVRAQEARASGELHAEAHILEAGLALWRGRPLADVPSPWLQTYETPRIAEEYLRAVECRVDVDLDLGRHADLVGELYSLTAEHPLRERFWCQLMLALFRSDRQADALSAYARIGARLREDLGINPGEQLRTLHRQILAADPALTLPRRSPTIIARRWIAPFQLPPDIAGFAARDDLASRVQAAAGAAGPGSHAVPIVTLAGPPGAGKTALAVHVAHQLQPSFPDGQLYANLRGYSSSAPIAASEVLERFLRALGVSPEQIPQDIDETGALLRSTLNSRRVLMVLDNARNSDQVRPLLPGSPTCAVIVTSRDNLHSLSALNGAKRIPVGTVSPAEALNLLTHALGERRVAEEREAAGTLAAVCGYLPLALRIVAANLDASPGQSVADTVQQLRSGNRLLAMTVDGDDEAAVRHAIELSYNTLAPELVRLFRLLSLTPGQDFDHNVAANLAGIGNDDARRLLARLAAANLIHNSESGRFQFHDLIRDYARDQARHESHGTRRQAYRRLFDFYVHAADSACRLLYPDLHPALTAPAPHTEPQLPLWDSTSAARHWLNCEVGNVVALACHSGEKAAGVPVWQLASASLSHLLRERRDSAWYAVFTAGLDAAERHGEPAAVAAMQRGLGYLSFLGTDYTRARDLFGSSLDTFRAIGNPAEQARVLQGLASVAAETGEYGEAVTCHERTLTLLGDSGAVASRATALLSMGTVLQLIGNTNRALQHLSSARALAEQVGLGHIKTRADAVVALHYMWSGRLESALAGFSETLSTWQEARFRQGVAETLRNMAEAHLEAERLPESLEYAQDALKVAEDVGYAWAIIGSAATLGISQLRLGHTGKAITHLGRARDSARAGLRHWYALATLGLAEYHRRFGDLGTAAQLADEVISDARPRMHGRAHAERAKVALALADLDACAHHSDRARKIAAAAGYQLDEARALLVLAEAYRERGDTVDAQTQLQRARQIFAEHGHRAAEDVQNRIDLL